MQESTKEAFSRSHALEGLVNIKALTPLENSDSPPCCCMENHQTPHHGGHPPSQTSWSLSLFLKRSWNHNNSIHSFGYNLSYPMRIWRWTLVLFCSCCLVSSRVGCPLLISWLLQLVVTEAPPLPAKVTHFLPPHYTVQYCTVLYSIVRQTFFLCILC